MSMVRKSRAGIVAASWKKEFSCALRAGSTPF
jgi:hypothetical protein